MTENENNNKHIMKWFMTGAPVWTTLFLTDLDKMYRLANKKQLSVFSTINRHCTKSPKYSSVEYWGLRGTR